MGEHLRSGEHTSANDLGKAGSPTTSAAGLHLASTARGALPDQMVVLVLAAASGLVYLRTLAPTVVAGNSAEYQYTSFILSIPHSTGYPLYTLLGKLFTFLPVGPIAYRINLLSAAAAVASVALVYFVLRELDISRAIAAATTFAFAFAASFWGAAVIAEVHTLNVALVALDVLLLLRWETRQRKLGRRGIAWRELRWFALAYGFSLTHHRTTVLLIPAFAIFIILTVRARPAPEEHTLHKEAHRRSFWPQAATTLLLFVLPLALYAYIPLRGQYYLSRSDPSVTAIYRDRVPEAILRGVVTAHYRQSWAGFINLVTGRDYAVDVGIDSWEQLSDRLAVWLTTLSEQFSPLGVALGVLGLVVLCRRAWRRAALFLLSYGSLTLFAILYVGHGQIWYYFLPTYVFWAAFMATAFEAIWRLLENRPVETDSAPRQIKPYVLYSLLCFALPAALLQHNWHQVDMSAHYIDRDRAQEVLSQNPEEGAVILGPWDLVTVVRYYQYAEGVRPDLVVVHADPTYSSGQKIIEKCVELGRPLYLLDFLPPAVEASQTGRRVRLTPIPYRRAPDVVGPRGEFGGRLALLGVKSAPNPVHQRPGTQAYISVQAFWRALANLDQNYTAFVQLIAPGGSIVSRVDESPASIYYPTSRWRAGQVFQGEYWLVIPPSAPAGFYALEIGLYDESGERVPATLAGASGETSVVTTDLEVQRGD